MFVQLKRLAGHSAVYTLGPLLQGSLNFLLLPLYTRALTPGDYGILGAVGPVYGLLSIVMGLGLQAALMRFYFEYDEDPDRLKAYVGTVALTVLVVGLVIALLLTVTGPQLFGRLLPGTAFDPFVLLTIWNAFLSLALILPQALLRVQQRPVGYVLLTVGDFLLTTVLIIVFVLGLREGALGNLRAQILAAGLMAVPALWVTARSARPTFRWADLAPSLAFSLPLLPHMLGNWALSFSDRVVLDRLVVKAELGRYTLGYQFGFVVNTVGLALNNAWVPFFYQHARDRRDERDIPLFVTYLVLPMAGLALAVSLLSREVIEVMAVPAYWSAYTVVPWVVAGYFVRYLYFFPVSGLFYVRQTRWVPVATLTAGAANVALNLLLVPVLGIEAAAVNTLVGFAILFVIIFAAGQRRFPVAYEYHRLARIIGLALVLGSLGWFIAPSALWARVAWKLALVAAYPMLLAASGFLTASERRRVRLLWQAARDRSGPGESPPTTPDQP